ncbi:MAG: hypothetical protein HYY52_00120 [Candidatus Melainabacteria bacterium]|nr:hypothetical protein [Candidatus Melainabacteria bacterium]
MKKFFRLSTLVLILLVALMIFLNSSNNIMLESSFLSLRVNVGFLIFFSAILGSIITLLFGISRRV